MSERFQSATDSLIGRAVLRPLAENWWVLLLRGIVAIAFGVAAFVLPGVTLLSLIYIWGIYALTDGILALWAAFAGAGAEKGQRWWLGLVGVSGIIAGLAAFFWPGLTATVLLALIASWAIFVGVMQIWGAIQLRKEMNGEWMLILSGVLQVAFGAILILQPQAGALSLVWIVGTIAIVLGLTYVGLAFRLKPFAQAAAA